MRLRVGQINDETERLQSEIERLAAEQKEIRVAGKALGKETAAFQDADVETMQSNIDEFNDNQKLVHKIDDIKRKEEEIETEDHKQSVRENLYKALTSVVPQKMLAKLKLPVKGLAIDGDDILVNDRSIDRLSTSEMVTFCLNVARAVSGKLKFICADRLESLSNQTRKLFIADATGDGFKYLLTFVTDGPLRMIDNLPEFSSDTSPGEPKPTKAGTPKSKRKPAGKTKAAQQNIGF